MSKMLALPYILRSDGVNVEFAGENVIIERYSTLL